MKFLKDLLRAWDDFFFKPRSALPLSIFRTAFGFFLIYYFIKEYDFLKLYYAPGGLFSYPEITPNLSGAKWSLIAISGPSYFYLWYGATFLVAICFALGFMTRLTSVLVWVLAVSWFNPLQAGSNGADIVTRTLSFLFMLAGVTGNLNRPSSREISSWPVRLFQIQLVLIYFFSGLSKAGSVDWQDGVALHYVFSQSVWSRFDLSFLAQSPTIVALTTYGSLFFELIIFPAFIWFRKMRISIVLMGILFHLIIGILMRIIIFTEIMPIFYLCFLEKEHYDWMREKMRTLCRWKKS